MVAKSTHFRILFILLIGFFLMPVKSFACDNNLDKRSCDKELSLKTENKDCCSNDSHSKSNNKNGCNGKCGHALCSVLSISTGITSTAASEIHDNVFNFSTSKRLKFYQSVASTSTGFSSIWLIPKIG